MYPYISDKPVKSIKLPAQIALIPEYKSTPTFFSFFVAMFMEHQ
jgi:hypothetical protein